MDKKSLNAVIMGPAATAGSIPILENKRGEKTPKRTVTGLPVSPGAPHQSAAPSSHNRSSDNLTNPYIKQPVRIKS